MKGDIAKAGRKMGPMSFIDRLRSIGVVAVIRGKSAQAAVDISLALIRGGITGIELTYTTPDCAQAVRQLREQVDHTVCIGVGTVRSVEQIEWAVEAGAEFAVSPHFEPDLMISALETNLPYLPGAITPTEMVQCWDSGAAAVKIFPANLVNPAYIKAVAAPLPDIPLMPTGGISPENFIPWLEAGAVAVGMGGNLLKGNLEEIEATARLVSQQLAAYQETSS
ncbi:MAG: bifunctional 4-hydroxy-2-oxoglutarate aldolase/2-dehydro-3-deoxy-phosphogluconate aldolase [Planctomycetota bacterium]|nr:MAG: bifunctional 4-hydroxy-2-oxoglutarate aldolase/2-dehydro-3-deoxy-phosphogluconate aldolase [Planctomycetota bacterium]